MTRPQLPVAAATRAAEGADRLEAAGEAMALVRVPVLDGGTWHGIDKAVWEMEAVIDGLAAETAGLALDDRQPTIAGRLGARVWLVLPLSPGLPA